MEEYEIHNSMISIPIALLLTSLAYCYFFVAYTPRGLLRVLSLIPIFYVFFILPWYSSSSFLRGILSFFITWISSFKLLLFCFDQGSLIFCKNYVDFVLVAIFPIKMKPNDHPSYATLKFPSELAPPVLIMVTSLYFHKEKFPQKVTLFLHSLCIIYGFYLLFTYGATLPVRYEIVQLFNKPYLAKSLQDFWGRRWNRLSSNILRETIYNPSQNSFKGIIGIGPAKVVALIFTLVTSGIMHELMFYYITCGTKPTWEVTQFFVLQGICMAFEGAFRCFARAKGWKPFHPLISNFFTLGFVLFTFYWLLLLPVWRSGRNECSLRSNVFAI